MKSKVIAISLIGLVGTVSFLIWHNQPNNDVQPEIYASENIALDGYDVVSFFESPTPVKGTKDFTYEYKKINWHFSNEDNLSKFKLNPTLYVPQYGGYCAYGMSKGYKAPTQIDTWTLVDYKLYFNYNQKVKNSWIEDQSALIKKANKNWQNMEHSNSLK